MIGPMTEAEIAKLATWLAKAGLEGRTETALVEGFCSRAIAGGLPLARAILFIDTLHPIHEGRAFRWERDKPEATLTEYGRTAEGEAAERWRTSPFFHMLTVGDSLLRRAHPGRRGTRVPDVRRDARGLDHRLRGDHQPLRRGRRDRRDGLRLFGVDDRPGRGLHRRGGRGAQTAHALPGACDQIRFPRPHRRDPGRDLSRTGRRPTGAEGPHRARA